MHASEQMITQVLAFSIENAVIKSRRGDPGMPKPGYPEGIWLGQVPLYQGYGEPVPFEPNGVTVPLPLHIRDLLKNKQVKG